MYGLIVFIAWWYFRILFHELGHVAAGLVVGYRPLLLTVGVYNRRTLFRIGDFQFQVGTNPFAGFVNVFPKGFTHYRLREIATYAGGPIFSLVLALALLCITISESSTRLPSWLLEVLGVCFLLEAYFFIMSLAPRKQHIEGRLVPNDARRILDTIRGSPRELRTSYESEVSHRVGRLLQENRGREAHELLAGECFGDEMTVGFKTIWIQLLDQYGRHDEADLEIDVLEASTSGEERVNALDALACLPLYYGNARRLPEAFRYIDEALQLAPDKWTLKGTKGSLLVDSGGLDDGIAMLEEVLSNTETALDRAISNYYLALAWHRKGDPAKCDLHWRRGLELDPDCIVKPRVKEAIFDS